MQTRVSLVTETAAALSSAGFKEPRRQARRLVASALAISPADLFGDPDHVVDEQQTIRLGRMLSRMVEHEPLSRILGRREFWGLEFTVSAATLDPRPESETIVEAVLRRNPHREDPLRMLDLGTGTGCLLLALLSEFPAATGIGIDIAKDAVATAIDNAAKLGLAERALFLASDWAAAVSGSFHIIVANPPYIASARLPLLPPEVARYDPWRALDGGADGLVSFRTIAAALPRLLARGGIFVAEVGAGQADQAAEIINAHGLAVDGIERDLAGTVRCVIARRCDLESRRQKMVGMRRRPV